MITRVRTTFTGVAGAPYYLNLFCQGNGAQFAPAVANFWNAARAYLNPQMTIVVEGSPSIFNETDGTLTGFATYGGATYAGAGTGEPLPQSTQLLLRYYTNGVTGSRKVQGRSFVPGLMESAQTTGTGPSTGVSDAFVQFYNTHIAATAVKDTNPHVVWTRPRNADTKYDRNTGEPKLISQRAGAAHLVTTMNVWSKWAVQRERRF